MTKTRKIFADSSEQRSISIWCNVVPKFARFARTNCFERMSAFPANEHDLCDDVDFSPFSTGYPGPHIRADWVKIEYLPE